MRTICAKAGGPPTSIDLSTDANYFQIATRTNQLQFYTVADGNRIASPAIVRDTTWASITVPLGWNVQGCWKSADNQSEVDNAVDDMEQAPRFIKRSCEAGVNSAAFVTSVHRSPDSRFLAKGCINGTVAVYNHPTHAPGMTMLQVPGHGSSIAKVRFTSHGKYLLALGQFNRTVTQYEMSLLENDRV